ncbi:MAG: 23S rRNA (adenine(2503)-C(2))-methyltransferase RlmN [Candidatus Kapaibacterium sp.]|jgi:23S rRNA (adenine2503-C2)-methyltransferase
MRELDPSVLQNKVLISDYTCAELETLFRSWNIEAYRARQVFGLLYSKPRTSFHEYVQLPAELRRELDERCVLSSVSVERCQVSEDGTRKYLFTLLDGARIESVLIPSELVDDDGAPKRHTLCISTQAGCPLGCTFCATATLKLQRNLQTAEIVDQFLAVSKDSGVEITNVVFMGMGEPMLNYDHVLHAVDIFTNPTNKLLSAKRITLSTAGVVPGIMRLADDNRGIKLALSLHATTNGLREQLMPIARKYSLEELGSALEYYYRCTKIPVTYEYIVFKGLNDTPLDVRRLARIARRVPSKVNVIPFHSIDFTAPTGLSAELRSPNRSEIQQFVTALREAGVHVMIRSSSGLDIDAACGQLALSEESSAP